MNSMQVSVRAFQALFGHGVAHSPGLIPRGRGYQRVNMISEEVDELGEATADGDLVEIADALGDILYLTFGTAVEYGIDLQPIFDEIHRSNMSKLDENGEPVPHPTVPGKIGKSELYSPPNLKPILEEQGWRA